MSSCGGNASDANQEQEAVAALTGVAQSLEISFTDLA